MLQFVNKYPSAKIITLQTGYRCSTEVYDAAHDLISNNELQFSKNAGDLDPATTQSLNDSLFKKLNSHKGALSQVTIFPAETETLELLYIAEQIKKLLNDGTAPEEIAVLYRNNSEAAALQEILEKWGIQNEVSIGRNALDNLYITQLLNLYEVIRSVTLGINSDLLFEVMQYHWIGLNRVSVYKLARIAGKLRKSIVEVLSTPFKDLQKNDNFDLSESDFLELTAFFDKVQHLV